jgi:hypothetical protein
MNYFLPLDIQREICLCLQDKDIKKINPKFYQDEDDVYWKVKASKVTDDKKPENKTYREFYEYIVYVKSISESQWYNDTSFQLNEDLLKRMLEDEIFMSKYVDSVDKYGDTALICSAMFAKKDYIEKLLLANADVNFKGELGRTALMRASQGTYTDSDIEIVQLLLDAGADVRVKDDAGWDAWSLSSYENNVPHITRLLDSKLR